MKFCLFYAWREMRRRPMRFVSSGCFLGIYSFIVSSVYGILTVYSGNMGKAVRQAGVLIFLILGMMTLVMCFLCLERYRACSAEYEAMQQYGLTEGQLQKIHIIQMLGLSVVVIPLAQLLSAIFCRVMISRNLRALAALETSVVQLWPEWYVARINFPSLSSATEYGFGYAVCAIFLMISGLLASLLADSRFFRKNASTALHALVSKNTGIISDWKSYQHLTYARIRKSFRHLRLISASAFFLPIFLWGASLLFCSVSGSVDMSVDIAETPYTEVDAALADSVMGIVGVECSPIRGDGDTVIILPLILDDRAWIQTVGEILSLPGIETYNVSVSRLSLAVTNLKYAQLRQVFGILALTALFAACIGVFYVIGDLFRSREEEFLALTMFGVPSLFHLKAISAFRMLLPGNIAVSIIGMLLVIGMNMDGGAVSGFWITRLASTGLCIGLVMPVLFACSAAYLLRPERRKS